MLLSITDFIGRFHPVLVHLPIGILLLALLLQWLSKKEQYRMPHAVLKLIWFLGIFSALLSCVTGYLLSIHGEYEENTVALHMWMGIGVAAVSLFVGLKVFTKQIDVQYNVASLVLIFLIVGTGHFGGSLTHGEDYLTAGLRDNNEEEIATVIKPIANVQEANVYEDIVQPMFEARCYSCHGPKKQKGKLRMDSPAFLLKGGEDGEIIKPGNAEQSELIKRLLLPLDHKEHMPPKQKPQLKEKQIALLHWWVEQGASFDKKVKDVTQSDKIKPVLASLQAVEEKKSEVIPEIPVEAADEKAMDALKKKGVVVLPVAQNSNYLMANFVTATDIKDQDLQLLLPLKKQLIWLKLNHTEVGDAGMSIINQCTNLRSLQLSHTLITDKGLKTLNSLKELESLNLVGTKTTADGVLSLKTLPKLKSLYLYQTGIGKDNWQQLKTAFPNTTLDTGGYVVPTLASDTSVVKPVERKVS